VAAAIATRAAPDTGANRRASARRSGRAVYPATVIRAATTLVDGSNRVPAAGQHPGWSHRYDHQRPASTRNASRTRIRRRAAPARATAMAGPTRCSGP